MFLKAKTNVEHLCAEATKVDANGSIGVTELQIFLVILVNMNVTSKEPYGREFRHAICEIH